MEMNRTVQIMIIIPHMAVMRLIPCQELGNTLIYIIHWQEVTFNIPEIIKMHSLLSLPSRKLSTIKLNSV